MELEFVGSLTDSPRIPTFHILWPDVGQDGVCMLLFVYLAGINVLSAKEVNS